MNFLLLEAEEIGEIVEKDRVFRFWNRFKIGLRSGGRQFVLGFKIWLWPSYLWADAVNICKILGRIGTRENEDLKIDLMNLMRAAGDGKFKTGKEFNAAKQKIMEKHRLRKQRLFDHKKMSFSDMSYIIS